MIETQRDRANPESNGLHAPDFHYGFMICSLPFLVMICFMNTREYLSRCYPVAFLEWIPENYKYENKKTRK